MNPILYVIYYLLKWFVGFALWVFYRKITVTGVRHHRSKNPCILVSNHPSTLLDPLNVATEVDAEIHFLANASLFRNKFFGWLLRKLYCIPIERYQDTGGKPLNNAASFEQAEEHLINGGCIYVAPEGSSFVERRLRKIKTGTARIALAAMQRDGWKGNLSILPVGLNYSDPTRFRSELLTVFGEYIPVSKFREDYEADPVNGVLCLSEAIEEELGKLIIDCEDGDQDLLLRRLETLLHSEKNLPPLDELHRSQAVLRRLRQWKAEDVAGYEAFQKAVFEYFEKLKYLKINDLDFCKPIHPSQSAGQVFVLAAAAKFALAGWLSHVLPCFITKKITDALNGDYHWVPTYKFAVGVVMYPLFISLQVWGVGELADFFELPDWSKWVYLAAIIPLGLLCEAWLKIGKRLLESRHADALRSNNQKLWNELMDKRKAIMQLIGSFN